MNISNRFSLSKVISGSLLIAGTTIGAGMLGIPLLTAKAGFWPACVITLLTWAFMLATGLLLLEVSLWMPKGSNLLSITERFLGNLGKRVTGGLFLFLYYCLLVAYFAAGAPLLVQMLNLFLPFELSGWVAYACFGVIFMAIVAKGAKWIDRTNLILIVGMFVAYGLLVGLGSSVINPERLTMKNWGVMLFAAPVLFSAFGYHNIIPSLCTYLNKDKLALKLSVIIGTTIPLIVYLLWQFLVIGSLSESSIALALQQGKPVTAAMQELTGHPWIYPLGQTFAFLAIVTSLLGVAFSMVDFLADGFSAIGKKVKRFWLVLMTFIPPFIFASMDPSVFDKALGVAGGFGEAALNGLIPVALVWIGRRIKEFSEKEKIMKGGNILLLSLFIGGLFVMLLEGFMLV